MLSVASNLISKSGIDVAGPCAAIGIWGAGRWLLSNLSRILAVFPQRKSGSRVGGTVDGGQLIVDEGVLFAPCSKNTHSTLANAVFTTTTTELMALWDYICQIHLLTSKACLISIIFKFITWSKVQLWRKLDEVDWTKSAGRCSSSYLVQSPGEQTQLNSDEQLCKFALLQHWNFKFWRRQHWRCSLAVLTQTHTCKYWNVNTFVMIVVCNVP